MAGNIHTWDFFAVFSFQTKNENTILFLDFLWKKNSYITEYLSIKKLNFFSPNNFITYNLKNPMLWQFFEYHISCLKKCYFKQA